MCNCYRYVITIKLREHFDVYSKIMDDCICIVHQCNSGNLSRVKLTLLFLQCAPHCHCGTMNKTKIIICSLSVAMQWMHESGYHIITTATNNNNIIIEKVAQQLLIISGQPILL